MNLHPTTAPEDRTFTIATDGNIVKLIQQAQQRIVFIAPGISAAVAKALGERLREEGQMQITVILDADPEVCRLGLGSLEGLTLLKGYSDRSLFDLRCQPGVRIGVLIADDKTLIYSPTPLLVEAGSTSVEKPNAIMLTGADVKNIAAAAGAGQTLLSSEIGQQALTPKEIQAVEEDVKRNPPKPFDLARQANVFSSKLQYVEFEVSNYKVSRKQAIIPSYLMGLDTENVKWRNSIQVLSEESSTVKLAMPADEGPKVVNVGPNYIEAQRKEIEDKYIYTIPGYGRVLFKWKQQEFENKVKEFEDFLASYFATLEEHIKNKMTEIADSIANKILPKIKDNPPKCYLEFKQDVSEKEILEFIKKDIENALYSSQIIVKPRIRTIYKDISYQSFMNDKFTEILKRELTKRHVPDSEINSIFKESLAALEKGKSLF